MGNRLSLGITTRSRNNMDKICLYTVADKDGDMLYVKDYSDSLHTSYEISKELKSNELGMWEWNTESKNCIKRNYTKFYELAIIPEIESLPYDEILKMLKDGINVSHNYDSNFLLLIDEDEKNYKVLEMRGSNNIKILKNADKHVIKLDKNATKINGHSLPKSDFITTENINIIKEDGKYIVPREIYQYTKLDTPSFIFDAITYEDKLIAFISAEMKKCELSKEQRRTTNNIVTRILTDREAIQNFFASNDFDVSQLQKKIKLSRNQLNDALINFDIMDKFSEAIIEGLPALAEKYKQLVKDQFELENKARMEELDFQILEKAEFYKKLQISIKKKTNNEDVLEKNLADLQIRYNDLNNATISKLSEVKKDITGLFSELSVYGLLSQNTPVKAKQLKENFIFKPGYMEKEGSRKINDLEEFMEALSSNLLIAGIESQAFLQVSSYIAASIGQEVNLLLTGRNALNVANAISATYSGERADLISITSPEITYNEIQEQLSQCQCKVVVIENLITQNNNATLQIIKASADNLDKLIILTSDLSETIKFIPHTFWDRCNLLCLDYVSEKAQKKDFKYTDSREVDFVSFDDQSQIMSTKRLKKIFGNFIYTLTHCTVKAELITRIEKHYEKNGLFSWMLCEVVPKHIISNDEIEDESLLELIKSCRLEEKQEKMLNAWFREC